jgi:hypothetical protein
VGKQSNRNKQKNVNKHKQTEWSIDKKKIATYTAEWIGEKKKRGRNFYPEIHCSIKLCKYPEIFEKRPGAWMFDKRSENNLYATLRWQRPISQTITQHHICIHKSTSPCYHCTTSTVMCFLTARVDHVNRAKVRGWCTDLVGGGKVVEIDAT